MTDLDLLPNGMRLGERVLVRDAATPEGRVLLVGEVVGWQPNPTVVIRRPDGTRAHLAVSNVRPLRWESIAATPDEEAAS